VRSVGSNRFVGQDGDKSMLNVNGIVAMTMIEEDGTLSLDRRQSERLTEDIGDLECLLVEAAG